jgi:transcriptional regulator with XRE-family HTH domain
MEEYVMNNYNFRCRELRKQRGLNQQELVSKLPISIKRETLSLYENGKISPNIVVSNAIANALNVSLDYLVGNTEIQSPDMDIREISEKTGLSEKAIDKLKLQQDHKKQGFSSIIDVINFLIENKNEDNILRLINIFLNTEIKNDVAVMEDGTARAVDADKLEMMREFQIDAKALESTLLLEIYSRLKSIKGEKRNGKHKQAAK